MITQEEQHFDQELQCKENLTDSKMNRVKAETRRKLLKAETDEGRIRYKKQINSCLGREENSPPQCKPVQPDPF